MEDIRQIEELLRKYYEGESTLEEERRLQWYFQTQDVPEKFRSDAEIFNYYYARKKDETYVNLIDKLNDLIDEEARKRILFLPPRTMYWMSGVAASVIILVTLWLGVGRDIMFPKQTVQYVDTYEDPKLAYLETKRVLLMVSDKMNAGTKSLQNIDKLNYGVQKLDPVMSFGPGIQHLNKLSKFNEATELISKKQ